MYFLNVSRPSHLTISVTDIMGEFKYEQAKIIHQNKYTYDDVIYINIDTKVSIKCPEHGVFMQTPYKHINSKQGCPKCRGERIRNKKRLSLQEYINKANYVHCNKYLYPDSQTIQNAHSKIDIICSAHGLFNQTINNHIYNKCGCPKCGYNVSSPETKWLNSLNIPLEFRQKILTINGSKFKVDAFNPKTKTIYEFFGYFWHGHPDYFCPNDVNPKNKTLFGDLYQKTLNRIALFHKYSYNVIYTWG